MRFKLVCVCALASATMTGQAMADQQKAADTAVKVASAEASGAGAATSAKSAKAPVKAANLVRPAQVSAGPTLIATINLSTQRMRVQANGETVGYWKISSGTSRHPTPTGHFRPQWTSRMHYSRKYDNAPMPYSVFFNGGIATHGTYAVGRLGSPASHGCVRLQTGNAREFYNLVHRHGRARTRIIVTGYPNYSHVSRAPSRRPTRAVTRAPRHSYVSSRRTRPTTQRMTPEQFQRRRQIQYNQRVQRYYGQRRLVYPGDRY